MGLLAKGTPLGWEQSKKHHAYIKEHGVQQFLSIYRKYQDRSKDVFLWGDEVEMLVLRVDDKEETVKLSLRAAELLAQLNTAEQTQREKAPKEQSANFLPEYGCFMVEATPSLPYGGLTSDLRDVETNMRLRRSKIQALLHDNERVASLTTFPLMGVGFFTHPPHEVNGEVCRSRYIPDAVISPHPRFATLTANIRERRGGPVCISVPLFKDKSTPAKDGGMLTKEELTPKGAEMSAKAGVEHSDVIHMDAMAFGMGCCCLQVTFQTRSVQEARHLYDHLAVLSPIMMALTASAPFFRGRVADTDVRWSTISQSVDDRTKEEVPGGVQPCGAVPREDKPDGTVGEVGATQQLDKSRYDSISAYIALGDRLRPEYNDLDLAIDDKSYKELIENGIDERLSRHIAHLFTRDPLVIYDESIESVDDESASLHFENIQSTNWQTVRFKPPPPGSPIGWRVEFRSMEVQLTDFENAAFTCFIALISRAILLFGLNLYIPISKVDENMRRAHLRDATRQQKFFFRNSVHRHGNEKAKQPPQGKAKQGGDGGDNDNSYFAEMSMSEILCGHDSFPGLIPLVSTYLDVIECDAETRRVVDRYLSLIEGRATGKLLTTASWLRDYVARNPKYNHDSVISQSLCYDVLAACDRIVKGELVVPELFGDLSPLASGQPMPGDGKDGDSQSMPMRGASMALELPEAAIIESLAKNMSHLNGVKE